jgi:hypothetical protein
LEFEIPTTKVSGFSVQVSAFSLSFPDPPAAENLTPATHMVESAIRNNIAWHSATPI